MTFVQWTNPLWAHHCGLDQGMTVVKRRPLRGTLFSVVVWIKAWKSTRVRGNYYILQNSWFGSIVAWIIVVWIKGWNSSRDDRFAEHYSPLWFGSRHEMLSRVRGNYYILQNSWLGSIVVWINCGLDKGVKMVKGWPLRRTLFSCCSGKSGSGMIVQLTKLCSSKYVLLEYVLLDFVKRVNVQLYCDIMVFCSVTLLFN